MIKMNKKVVYPYIPNSTNAARSTLIKSLEITSAEDVFSAIPSHLRLDRPLNLPGPILSEYHLEKHVNEILDNNQTANDLVSFLGSGCYQHFIPVVCDEISHRNEFLTAYSGKSYEDHGRYQALFEYQSMMAELLNMDVVNLPTYDGLQASASAMRMAANITGRKQILVGSAIHPEKSSKFVEYNGKSLDIVYLPFDDQSGELDMTALRASLSKETAAIYLESPNFFGVIETKLKEISALAHRFEAIVIVNTDPISLGVLVPPADLGADITCGDIQSLGIHMQFGGGQAGFMATRNDPKYVLEFPNRIYGLVPTVTPGESGFGEVAFDRTSFVGRENGKEWVGTMANLWAITAGVYLSLMGPQGMRDVGELIESNVRYAILRLSKVPGIKIQFGESNHFREIVLDFSKAKKTVEQINRELLKKNIMGGYDISGKFEGFDNHAVYCFTEVQNKETIDALEKALREVLA